MTKFQFNYLENKLSRIYPNNPEYSYLTPEENHFIGQFGSQCFILGDNHRIIFTVKSSQITAFYKKALDNEEVIYYRRNFVKSDVISFEFTEEDIIEKNARGQWIKKISAVS